MAEDGITHPSQDGLKFMRDLVEHLSALDPDAPVGLDNSEGKARFTDVRTGALLGELRLRDV
jgi:hypothetical protein